MRCLPLIALLCFLSSLAGAEPLQLAPAPHPAPKKVVAVVESSLKTRGGQIRQFAFDDNPNTYFESEKNPTKDDSFTLTLDAAVSATGLTVQTGKPDGTDTLGKGIVEVSIDGKKYHTLTTFSDGTASSQFKATTIRAVRIRPTEDLNHPLVIREIGIDSMPAIAMFKYPVEFVVDSSDAPEMKEWAEKAAKNCERHYGMICEELASPGFKPYTVLHLTLKNDYNGVAEAGGDRIKGSVKFFKSHPDDLGAMIHETAHCVQRYRSRGNPGWLVEGIADYVRFFKYEPGNIGRLRIEQAKYDASYRITAAFLAFVTAKYNPQLVNKLNAIMRDGKYSEDIWKELTGKTVEELNQEWRRSLVR